MKKHLLSWLLSLSISVGTLASPVWAETSGVPATVTNDGVFVESADDETSAFTDCNGASEVSVNDESGVGFEEPHQEISEENDQAITESAPLEETAVLVPGDEQEQEEVIFVEEEEVTGYPVLASSSGASTYAANTAAPSENEVYSAMLAKKSQYPEGMTWTNSNYYSWKGGTYMGGYGCAGFAFLLSDAAFGTLPGRVVDHVTMDLVHVGDILRINNDSHMVIVLEVRDNSVIIAEGNYAGTIHWGRELSASVVNASTYMITRYPKGTYSEIYTVSYNANGGSGAPEEQIEEVGHGMKISTVAPTRFGYEFKGWSTSSSSTMVNYAPGASYTRCVSMTLYAIWNKSSVATISNTYPQSLTASVNTAGRVCYYRFTPDATAIYTFESTGSLDPIISICDESGNLLFENDDFFGQNFQIKETFTAGKTYIVAVRLYYKNTGSVNFSIKKEVNPYVISNVLPRRFQVSITSAEPTRIYDFTPAATADYIFESSGSVDSVVTLCDTNGNALAGDDNSAGSGNFLLQATLAEGKTYKLHFSTRTNVEGVFKVSVSSIDATGVPLGLGSGVKENPAILDGAMEEAPAITPAYEPEETAKAAVIRRNPESVTAAIGDKISFEVVAEHAAEYQWQYSKDGVAWKNSTVNSAVKSVLNLTVNSTNLANIYRCKVTGEDGKAIYSASADITEKSASQVAAPVIKKNPDAAAVAMGTSAKFHVEAEGASAYQWQYSKDGSKWSSSTCTGSTTDTVTVKASEVAAPNLYRCKITGADGSVIYSEAAFFVILTKEPKNTSVEMSKTAVFSLTGSGIASYQWQYSKDGVKWNNSTLSTAVTDTLKAKVSDTTKGYEYRCKLVMENGAVAYTKSVRNVL